MKEENQVDLPHTTWLLPPPLCFAKLQSIFDSATTPPSVTLKAWMYPVKHPGIDPGAYWGIRVIVPYPRSQ